MTGQGVALEDEALVPPVRRGTRDERRDATVRDLAAGKEALCAFCGAVLPPIPARGGRPTPYCAADPERYGTWGAKVISCALLDEQREIWVRVFGADQPITPVDVEALRAGVSSLAAALDAAIGPVREDLAAVRHRLTEETAAAVAARDLAHRDRDTALDEAHTAREERDAAHQRAERAEQQATVAAEERTAALDQAEKAEQQRDQARTAQQAAEQDRDTARGERQQALTQVTTVQERVTELQDALAAERAAALAALDEARRVADERIRDALATQAGEHDRALRTRTDDLTRQLDATRQSADERVDRVTTDLTSRLSAATADYTQTLASLHDQLTGLRTDLAASQATSRQHQQQLTRLRTGLTHLTAPPTQPSTDPTRDHNHTPDQGPDLRAGIAVLLADTADPGPDPQ
jgi:hypothetical protein